MFWISGGIPNSAPIVPTISLSEPGRSLWVAIRNLSSNTEKGTLVTVSRSIAERVEIVSRLELHDGMMNERADLYAAALPKLTAGFAMRPATEDSSF